MTERQDQLSFTGSTVITHNRLTQSSCHVVGRTVTGMPDQLSFLIASAKTRRGLFVCLCPVVYKLKHSTQFSAI